MKDLHWNNANGVRDIAGVKTQPSGDVICKAISSKVKISPNNAYKELVFPL